MDVQPRQDVSREAVTSPQPTSRLTGSTAGDDLRCRTTGYPSRVARIEWRSSPGAAVRLGLRRTDAAVKDAQAGNSAPVILRAARDQ